MTHQFHRAFHAAANNEGGILNIGPAAISIDNANLRAFVDAVEAVEAIRREADDESSSFPVADAALLDGTDWGPVAYVPERDSYNVRYRGLLGGVGGGCRGCRSRGEGVSRRHHQDRIDLGVERSACPDAQYRGDKRSASVLQSGEQLTLRIRRFLAGRNDGVAQLPPNFRAPDLVWVHPPIPPRIGFT